MKRFLLILTLLLIQTLIGFGQATTTSKIINAEQLLQDVKILSADDMEGRDTGTAGGAKARNYVLERFKQSNLKPFADNYLQPFEFTRRQSQKVSGVNVVGYIKGKKNPEKYLVVTAHYDHVGTRNGKIYNGADDNASGTAALFAMAKYFDKNRPDNSIIFVAFDAEEQGLQGSKYFVANLPVKKEEILLNLNMDMISHNDKNELYATGTFQNPSLKPTLETVQKKSVIKLLLGHDDPKLGSDDWTFQSDQGSFYKEKIPFIYFGVEDHKDYHQPTDDFETITQSFYVHAVETILEAVKEFDKNLQKK
ncbi:MAG: M20/M25/M40 family metallo-hydrolase [Pyrinomonadaceae bacterium]|nr:M20/M25/M40 family metallo-hydrolase [Pyrinomonadaceae bacterium]